MKLAAFVKQIEWPGAWRLAATAGAVGVMAWSSITLTREAGNVASIWLSDGLLLGVLLTARARHGAAYLIAGYLANFVADRSFGDSTVLALSFSACNMLGVAIAAKLLRIHLADAADFVQRRSFTYFLLYGVALAPALSAFCGAAASHYFLGISFPLVFSTWYMAVALGNALVTPLVLSMRRRELTMLFGKAMIAKTLGILMLTVVATVIVSQSGYPLRFIMFPILMLVIFELGFTGTAIALFLIAIIAIMFTVEGSGPLKSVSGLTAAQQIFFVQVTIATAALVALPMAVILAEHKRLSTALEKANNVLRSLAMTDGLTGLANRRHFDDMMGREWRRTARESGLLSLLFLDIDHFKPYNDCYGHRVGDDCLQRIAQLLMQAVRRSGDFCARYGGEEFAIILPNTDIEHAVHMAESVRAGIESLDIEHAEVPGRRITVSIGVACVHPRDGGVTITGLIDSADRALYAAKRGGRNRIVTA